MTSPISISAYTGIAKVVDEKHAGRNLAETVGERRCAAVPAGMIAAGPKNPY